MEGKIITISKKILTKKDPTWHTWQSVLVSYGGLIIILGGVTQL
jgi:hypothetical protein